MRIKPANLLRPAAILLLGMCGCQPKLWHEKTDARREHRHKLVSNYARYDIEGIERIDRSLKNAETLCQYHQDHLVRTADFIENKFASDQQRWRDEQPRRRSFIRRQFHGAPETIPATWAKMVY